MIRPGIVWLFALFAQFALCQPERSLTPESTLNETARAGEIHSYRFDVPEGRAIDIAVLHEHGTPGLVLIRASDGAVHAQMDLAQRIPAARRILISAGTWRLEVLPANRASLEATYEVRAGPLVDFTAGEATRIAAERQLGEGEEAHRRFDAGRLEASLGKYEASLALWVQPKNRAREVDAVRHAGAVRYELSRLADVRAAYQRALDLARTENDPGGESAALDGLARVAIDSGQTKEALSLATDALSMRRDLGDFRGQAASLRAPATSAIHLTINGTSVTPAFAGLSGPGLFQFNLTIPSGLGTGDQPLLATAGAAPTQSGVVLALQ